MELFQLRYFVAAAKRGNFSRAAEEVCVSQPSLSLQIANLEKEIGTALFARQGRSVRLTDAGVTLLEHAERILEMEAEARRAVRQVVGLERGRLSLWTLPTLGQHLLPPRLAAFVMRTPESRSACARRCPPARSARRSRRAGRIWASFICPVRLPDWRNGYWRKKSWRSWFPPATRWQTSAAPVPLAAVAGEDFVWAPEGATLEHPLFAACVQAGFAPKIACVSGSAQGMQALVAAGLGIALLPRLAIAPPSGAAVVELAPPRPTRTLAVVGRARP
jgi:DNA-binding transcriptional LysR family regulator